MIHDFPKSVNDYLTQHMAGGRAVAYFRVNEARCVELFGGSLQHCGISSVDTSIPIDDQIDALIGLLPIGSKPVIIENAHMSENQYFTVLLLLDSGQQWVVIVDNTVVALKDQVEQQERLCNDIIEEKLGGVK